jgi:hypothetical protein
MKKKVEFIPTMEDNFLEIKGKDIKTTTFP